MKQIISLAGARMDGHDVVTPGLAFAPFRAGSRRTSLAVEVVDDCKVTPAGRARTGSAGVHYLFRCAGLRTWSRLTLDFLFGRSRRHQAAAPSVDEPSDLYRTSVHESGHALAARLLGKAVLLATTVPDPLLGFGGRVITGSGDAGRAMSRSLRDGFIVVDEIAAVVERHMPGAGETKDDAAPWLTVVHGAVVEWLAGAAAESVAFGSADDRRSRSDYLSAQRYARTICASDVAAEAFLEFALIEAVELITPYRPVLLALAAELVERRELDGAEIDQIISATLVRDDRDRETVRRANWQEMTRRAQAFEKDRPQ